MRMNIALSIAAVQEYKYTCIHLRLQTIVHFIALRRTEDTRASSRGAHSVSSWNYCCISYVTSLAQLCCKAD
jgi:hypothetical protein